MILEISATILVLVVLYALRSVLQPIVFYYTICKKVKNMPGLPTHWLYGNLHQKTRDGYDLEMYDWVKQNNIAVSKEWLGPFTVMVNVHDPDVLKTVVKAPKAVGLYHQLFGPWLGQGLLISSGKRWARNRRLLTNAFHFDILKPYVETYNDAVNELITKWEDHAHKSPNSPLSIYSSISHLTLDILLRCSFSYNSNCQKDSESTPYINAVLNLSKLVIGRLTSLNLLLNNTVYLYCTRQGRQFRHACDVVHSHANKVIQERKKVLNLTDFKAPIDTEDVFARAKRNHKQLDFLDILLTARDDSGNGLSDIEIRYEVDTFMFEGFDTTAHGLCWAIYCLAKWPEHQDKCREEVNKVLGNREYVEFEDLANLSYMHMCIKEAFRLFPPVYAIIRQLDEDSQVGDYSLPKGTYLYFRFYNIHRNPKHWKDPETYNPLRFSSNEFKDPQNPFAHVPFSAGPRNCIGQNFAMNEERVALARIIKRFKFRLADDYEVDQMFALLLHMKNDIQLNIEPI